MAECRRLGDGDGRLRKLRAILREEPLPGRVAAQSAGLGQREFGQMQRAQESGPLRRVGRRARGLTVVEPMAQRGKSRAELIAGEAGGFGLGRKPQFVEQRLRNSSALPRSRWSRGERQRKIAGVGRGRVHD